MRTFDSNYRDWKVGDKVVPVGSPDMLPLTVKFIDREGISYEYENGDTGTARLRVMLRVTEDTKVDLEKLINDLCELPSLTLHGLDAIEVRYANQWNRQPTIALEGWDEAIHLESEQALALLDWLSAQRQNLESLRDALQAKQIEDEATKEQRAAERINALKALHSEAVTEWQQGGCVGPCPSYADIVIKEQFVRVDLIEGSANPVTFVKHYPMLERLRKEQRG